jgi:hypothetical protein
VNYLRESPGSKIFDVLFSIICLAGAFLCLWFFWADLNRSVSRMNEEALGTITWKHRAAQRRFIDRILWDRLQRGSPVYSGDLIRTAELSETTVSFFSGGTIALEENSIVQIFLENDIPRIELSGGNITVSAQGSELTFSAGGKLVTIQDGDAAELRSGINGSETPPDIETKQIVPVSVEHIPAPIPLTPAEGQVFSYNKELPQLRFRWAVPTAADQSEEAAFYLLEASDNQNMNNPQLRIQTQVPAILSAQLGSGRWYWRITPAYGNGRQWGNPSQLASFVIEQNPALVETAAPAVNIAAAVKPETPQAPRIVAPVTPTAAPVAAAVPVTPATPAEAPPEAPRATFPPDNYVYNAERLQGISAITFRWDPLDGAAAYNFTLSGVNGARILGQRVSDTSFALSDLSVLSRGSFIWQVEALDRSGTRLGTAARSRFTVDLPEIQRTQLQDLGTMYGNN